MSAHEAQAQAAAEEAVENLLLQEDEGAACSCTTCVAREALEAAWPHLRALAFEEASHLLMGVSLEAKNPTELIQKLATLIDEWRPA